MKVVIVSDSEALIADMRRGLEGSTHVVDQVFMKPDDFRSFLEIVRSPDLEFFLIIDTYVGLPYPLEGGEYKLEDDSPSMTLLGSALKLCPRSYRLAITHGGSMNDGQMAIQAGAQHFVSCSVPDVMVVLARHVDMVLEAYGPKPQAS